MLGELFQSPALWFTIPALLGTGIFLIKLGLVMVGFGDHGGTDGGDGHHAGDGDASGAFKLVSVQAAFGFIMGFGWCGLVCLKSFEWSPGLSVLGGLVGGAAFGLLVSALLHSVKRLETSGNLTMAGAVGHEGDVYANVPAKGQGRGQVRIVLGTRERIVQASSDGSALATGSRVKVVQANADNSIIVAPV